MDLAAAMEAAKAAAEAAKAAEEAAKAGKVSAKRLDALAAETPLPDAAWAAHLLDSAGAGAAAGAGGSGVQAARALKK